MTTKKRPAKAAKEQFLSLMVPGEIKDGIRTIAKDHGQDMNKVANMAIRIGLPLVEAKLDELFGGKAA